MAGLSLWQRGYYEHIIRDSKELDEIAYYIRNNPRTWDADKLYQKQLEVFEKMLDNNIK